MPRHEGCTPVRCPTTSIFDLDAMLEGSIAREDSLLDADALLEGSIAREDSLLDALANEAPNTAPIPNSSTPSANGEAPGQPRNYQHRYRKRKREAEIREIGHVRRQKTLATLVPLAVEAATTCRVDYIDLPATEGAYSAMLKPKKGDKDRDASVGMEVPELEDRVYTLQEVEALGIRVFPWDGINPVPFVDAHGRVFLVLAGRPTDDSYTKACEDAYELLEATAHEGSFTPQNLSHRRGDYPVINVGVTHGMGTLRPTYLDLKGNTEVVERILGSKAFQRLASYGSAAFGLWFPKNYRYYKGYLDSLFENTSLRRIFPKSVFPSAALNCGPQVCTKKHKDCKNCPFGVCTVASLGRFNPKTGGHLILWELGLAVEFPSGSTILLPSATISHSNTPVLEGEVRASFTQYASGGLFRWVDNGFQTVEALQKKSPASYREMLRLRPDRWKVGVGLYSTFEELKSWVP